MRYYCKFLCLAGPTGFEPAISSVTGRRDRPTSLRARVLPYAHASFCRERQKLRLSATVVLPKLHSVATLLGLQFCASLRLA